MFGTSLVLSLFSIGRFDELENTSSTLAICVISNNRFNFEKNVYANYV